MQATTEQIYSVATHNCVVTVTNPETGNHRTLRIRTMKQDSKFAPGERVAELLVGPDNTSDYKGFGFVLPSGQIQLWKKNADSPAFRWYAKFLSDMDSFVEQGFQVQYQGSCRRCSRPLTDPESISSGIGPTCAGLE
jgi:hypothetical protein